MKSHDDDDKLDKILQVSIQVKKKMKKVKKNENSRKKNKKIKKIGELKIK